MKRITTIFCLLALTALAADVVIWDRAKQSASMGVVDANNVVIKFAAGGGGGPITNLLYSWTTAGDVLGVNVIQWGAMCAAFNNLYIFASNDSQSTNLNVFNGSTISQGTKPLLSFYGANAEFFNNKMYLAGAGGRSTNFISTTDGVSWVTEPKLLLASDDMTLLSFSNVLWSIGGQGSETMTNVFQFNGTTWTPGPKLPRALRFMGGCVFRDRLIIGGGPYHGGTNFLSFDGTTWTSLPKPPITTWSAEPSMPMATNNYDQLIAVNNTNAIMWDGTNWHWITKPNATHGQAVTVMKNYGGKVYIAGSAEGNDLEYLTTTPEYGE